MLRLIKNTDPLRTENVSLCVYSLPDYGKTSLGFTANKPLLIDFDGLVTKARNRDRGDVIRLDSWADLEGLKKLDLSPYSTIVIDTAGRAVNLLQEHVKTLEMSNKQSDGNLSLKGWGVTKRLFKDLLDWLMKTGKDVVLLVHLAEEKSGDTMLDRLDIEGGSKAEVYKSALAICRIVIQGKNNQRFLDFSPRENAIGKNPGQLGLIPYDDPAIQPNTLAKVLEQIKDVMNKPVAKPAVAAKPVAAVPAIVPQPAAKPKLDAATVLTMQMQEKAKSERLSAAEEFLADVNPKLVEIKKQPAHLKRSIHAKALSLGLRYNPETNFYELDPDQTANGAASARGNQGTDNQKPAARESERDQTRGLPFVVAGGVAGHNAALENPRT